MYVWFDIASQRGAELRRDAQRRRLIAGLRRAATDGRTPPGPAGRTAPAPSEGVAPAPSGRGAPAPGCAPQIALGGCR